MRILLAFTSRMFEKQSDEKKVRITVNAQDLASFPQRIQGFSGTPPSIALHPRIVMDVDRNTGGYLQRRIEDIKDLAGRGRDASPNLRKDVDGAVGTDLFDSQSISPWTAPSTSFRRFGEASPNLRKDVDGFVGTDLFEEFMLERVAQILRMNIPVAL